MIMFKYFWSRIFIVVVGVVLLTVLSITFLAQSSVEKAVFKAEEQHAVDLLKSVLLGVHNEWESLNFHKKTTLEMRKSEIKSITTIAISQISRSHAQYKQGVLSKEQAKQQAIGDIRGMRYDGHVGYLWINNLEKPIPKILMHPISPELEGVILDQPKYFSALGMSKHVLVAMADICRKDGEGNLDYLWPKPTTNGITDDQPKISYVRLFKEWGWVVGTGVYVDDIQAEVDRRLNAIIKELEKTFSQLRIAETGYLFLFNGKKEMIIHPNISGKAFASMINPDSGKPLVDELIKASEHPMEPFDYTWDKPGYEKDYRFKKRAYISCYKPLDWYIGSSVYMEELKYPRKVLRQRIIIHSITVLALAFIISIVLARNLVTPLKKLTLAGEEIKTKGLDNARIPVNGTLETQQLGVMLNGMIESIQKANRQREHAMEALIAGNQELASKNTQLAQEICERMSAQKALKSAHDLLEQRVDERTAELADTNLKLEWEIGVRKKSEKELQKAMHQLQSLNKELKNLASIDSLTGVSNRRNFLSQASVEIARATRMDATLSLLMLDIDHFKQVNDRYGHQTGDQVLKAFAQKITKLLRPIDIMARLGGEEFSVLLPGADLQAAVMISERIRCEVQNMRVDGDGGQVRVTVSIGIVQFGLEHNTIERLIALADKHLYLAKNSGRNRVFSGS